MEESLIKVGLELRDPYERHSHKRLSTDPPPSSVNAIINRKFTVNGNINKQTEKTKTEVKDSVLADYVENVARALFLIVYMVFNCVYWAKYRNSK